MGNENPEEHNEGNEPDYKALWEKEKANSRKWEKQAKSNKDAAERLAKVEEDGTSVEERISDLTKRLDEKERAEGAHEDRREGGEGKGRSGRPTRGRRRGVHVGVCRPDARAFLAGCSAAGG